MDEILSNIRFWSNYFLDNFEDFYDCFLDGFRADVAERILQLSSSERLTSKENDDSTNDGWIQKSSTRKGI